MSLSYGQLVDYGISRGLSRDNACKFADDVTKKGTVCPDTSAAELLLVPFAVTAGIVLAVDDALGGIPSTLVAGAAGIALGGLGLLFDVFDF